MSQYAFLFDLDGTLNLSAMEKISITNDRYIIFEDSIPGLSSAKQTNPKCIVGIINNNNKDTIISYGANITIEDYDIDLEVFDKYL